MILAECFKLGEIRTSLIGLKPNNRYNSLLNIPTKMVTTPKIIQKGNMVFSPFMLVRTTKGISQRQRRNPSHYRAISGKPTLSARTRKIQF
jgi:hypothetical protein